MLIVIGPVLAQIGTRGTTAHGSNSDDDDHATRRHKIPVCRFTHTKQSAI
jgi:hypothetical protein